MMKKTGDIIRDLQERQVQLQKQIDAQDAIIQTKAQKIQLLEEEVILLNNHNKELSEGINKLLKGNEELEQICVSQQALLDEFSKMIKS